MDKVAKGTSVLRYLEGIFPERIGTVDSGAIGGPWFKVTKSAGGTKVMFNKEQLAKIEQANGLLSRVVQVAKSGQTLSTDAQKAVEKDIADAQTLMGISAVPAGLGDTLNEAKKMVDQGIEDSNDLNVSESLENVGSKLSEAISKLESPSEDKTEDKTEDKAETKPEPEPEPEVKAEVKAEVKTEEPKVEVKPEASVETPVAPEPVPGSPDGNVPVTKADLQAFADGMGQKMAEVLKPLVEAQVAKAGPTILPNPLQQQGSVTEAGGEVEEDQDDPLAFEDLNDEIRAERRKR